MATMNETQLLAKKKEIEKTKSKLSELKGEEKALLKQLNDNFGINSLEAAKKKIEKYKQDLEDLDEKIEKATEELEETYFSEED